MKIKPLLRSIALKYPPDLIRDQLNDIDRIAHHIELILKHKGTNIKICDIGGGIGLFSIGCAALGMDSMLIDDFKDEVNLKVGMSILRLHQSYGVKVVSRDVLKDPLGLELLSLDAVTTFDSMEHWHSSPRALFHSLKAALKPGGLFIIGVPNCVNLRKRITVPFGYGKWSSMKDWYEKEVFRAHVREPDVDDLKYIARDIGLKKITISGRNWLGLNRVKEHFNNPMVLFFARVFDSIIRLYPSLCSDIYLMGYI